MLRLQLGSTTTTVKHKGYEVDLHSDTQLFAVEEPPVLEVVVMEKESSQKVVFAALPLQQLMSMPNTEHSIKINLIYRNGKTKELEGGNAGTLNLRLKYNSNVKGGLLDVRIERAALTRDTELIGKMDPYVEIVLGGQKVRTSVKDEAGKTPVWMEQYTLSMTNQLEQLRLTVFDEDITTDDLVG